MAIVPITNFAGSAYIGKVEAALVCSTLRR
jgi:hypothetical protein